MIVVEKPAGTTVYREDPQTPALLDLLRERGHRSLFPIHRIDKPTSGLLIFGKDGKSTDTLQLAFRKRQVVKIYQCVVHGIPEWSSIEQKEPVWDSKRKEKLSAQTKFQRGALFPSLEIAIVSASPLTGRYHQIRQHLRQLGHPIVGDVSSRIPEWSHRPLYLHCTELRFPHPRIRKIITLKSPAKFFIPKSP